MTQKVSPIWNNLPEDLRLRLNDCLDAAKYSNSQQKRPVIFFRADDVAVPSDNFSRLMSLFYQYRMPLCLAVVPAWLTHKRWAQLYSMSEHNNSLWCWHQHGWRHVNHSKKGKKYEFGPDRPLPLIQKDLIKGRARLRDIMGENFYPVFTPPWNRCDDHTLALLKELKYKAVSRNSTKGSGIPEQIIEYNVHVDLHTRKEKRAEEGWANLLDELSTALANGMCGIMIHHQLMNHQAFVFLESVFQILEEKKSVKALHFKDLIGD